MISRPPVGQAEYYVELKPGLDQVQLSRIIAARVSGKVGYIYRNFHAFTIYSFPDTMVARIRQMREVLSIRMAQSGKLD